MAEIREVSTNVKDLIFAYERQTSSTDSLEHYEGRRRAKSIGNALSYKLFRQSNLEIHHLVDIEKELVKIEAHLNYYEVYEKDTQVAFQEQLLNVLTFIVNIDPEGDENYRQKKKDLIAETQKLFKILTSKLPVYGVHSYRSIQRTASRREEAIVSSTSVRSHERRGISSSQTQLASTNFKSEESLEYSNKDSSSVDLNTTEERAGSVTPPQISITSETDYIPSVSKLKKFFSFRRDDNIKVTPNSGVSRSQSLNIKSNKYTVFKKREEVLNENDEEGEFDKHGVLSSTHINANDENLYEEPVAKIEEYREIQNEQANSVSVSKLKSLFEVKQKETEEGLGSLTNNQPNEFHSDFNLPYTEANLGAFRLKRTISGHYMNFTGLLRNIDIQKKADLNKSKSLSDLKSNNLQYELNDLSKEVDDDAHDFEHVSINVGREDEELNNNEPGLGQQILQISEDTTATQSSATFVIGSVKALKKTFENHSSSEIHRIIEPIQHQTDGEPVLKVPIQLRTGFGQGSHSEKVVENDPNVDDPNADIKHILHRTIDPIPNPNSNLQEPVLKIPIQLRTGFLSNSHDEEEDESVDEPVLKIPVELRVAGENVEDLAQSNENLLEETVASGTVEALKQTFETRSFSNEFKLETSSKLPQSDMSAGFIHVSRSEKKTLNGLVTKDEKEDIILHSTNNPNIEAPIQFRTGLTQINDDSQENGTNGVLHPKSNLQEPVIIQLRTGISQISHGEEEVIEQKNGSIEEAVLKIPVQLRLGMGNVEDDEKLVEGIVTSGTVEALKQTFETRRLSLEASPKLPRSEKPELRISEMGTDFVHVSRSAKEIKSNTSQIITSITSPNGTVTLHSTVDQSVEEPVQVSTGFAQINNDAEGEIKSLQNGNATIVSQESVTSGTVEALKQTFEHLSTKTEETSEELALKVPIEYRGFDVDNHSDVSEVTKNDEEEPLNNSESTINTENEVEELNIASGTVEALKQSFEHLSNTFEASTEDIVQKTGESIPNSVPIQLRNSEDISYEYKVIEPSEENSIEEQQINGGAMNILESPTMAFSSLLSIDKLGSSSHIRSQQVSSSSKVSVSYSQKTSVQRTSQKRIISSSSSSSGLLSQKYFEVLKNSSSPTTEESTVTISEVEDQETPKYNLNISQENLIDEILKETDSYKNVDEEFEKLLENTN